MPPFGSRGRHAKPSPVAPAVAAGSLTSALLLADGALVASPAAAAAPPTAAVFEALAACESGQRWNINTGNGYFGGLQFSLATWRSLGYGGYPHQASKATQIEAGQRLQARSGWGQWPACARKLNLFGAGPAAARHAAAPSGKHAASRSRTASQPVSAAQLPFGGDLTTAAGVRTKRADAAARVADQRGRLLRPAERERGAPVRRREGDRVRAGHVECGGLRRRLDPARDVSR